MRGKRRSSWVNAAFNDHGGFSPRSRNAELTQRSSQKTDWDKGRWTLCSIDPFLAYVSRTGDLGIVCAGAFCDPRAGGCRPTTPDPWGSLRGLAPSCTRRRVPPSRRRGATLSRGEPTVLHCRRAPFSVGKRGVRYPFVPKAGRCRRRWVSSTQSFESRSARVPR